MARKASKISAEKPTTANAATEAGNVAAIMALAAAEADCDKIVARVNALNARQCAAKVNTLPHFEGHTHTGCSCGGGSGSGPFLADVIVLIDTSGSMGTSAAAVSSAAAAAIAAAKGSCNVDLRIQYFGVEGTWPSTLFTANYLTYLTGLGVAAAGLPTNNPVGGYGPEEGANAIEALAKHYDWRADACRAIFYISDEELDSISPLGDTANEALAVSNAVAAAKAANVTVFAHHLTYQNRGPAVIQNYKDLCNQTGGTAYFSAAPDQSEYTKMLAEAICGSCGKPTCETAKVPDYEPCISVSWGESKCDCFETDDVETVCITVCNCYSNLVFSDFNIAAVFVTQADGSQVPLLPDGTPSVEIVPMGPICFGDIPACADDKPGCVSRQFTVRTRGAKAGKYQLRLAGVCYDLKFHKRTQDSFLLTLCAD